MMNPAEILTATIHHGQEKIKRPFFRKSRSWFYWWGNDFFWLLALYSGDSFVS